MTSNSPQYETSGKKLLAFVREHKIVTESAKSVVPSMVRFMVGHDFKGSWWSLPQSSRLYNALQPLRCHAEIHVCRLVKQRVCYVHRSIWAPLVRLAEDLPVGALDKVVETHEESGAHSTHVVQTPVWVPADIQATAASMSKFEARELLAREIPQAETVLSTLGL